MQKERFLISLRATESAIQKNIKLEDLHDRNETLYHRILVDHIEGAFTKQKKVLDFFAVSLHPCDKKIVAP